MKLSLSMIFLWISCFSWTTYGFALSPLQGLSEELLCAMKYQKLLTLKNNDEKKEFLDNLCREDTLCTDNKFHLVKLWLGDDFLLETFEEQKSISCDLFIDRYYRLFYYVQMYANDITEQISVMTRRKLWGDIYKNKLDVYLDRFISKNSKNLERFFESLICLHKKDFLPPSIIDLLTVKLKKVFLDKRFRSRLRLSSEEHEHVEAFLVKGNDTELWIAYRLFLLETQWKRSEVLDYQLVERSYDLNPAWNGHCVYVEIGEEGNVPEQLFEIYSLGEGPTKASLLIVFVRPLETARDIQERWVRFQSDLQKSA